jgi:hypothetical protein
MEKKTTYLFGAGASIYALPILNGMPQRMDEQIDFIKHKAENILSPLNLENDKYTIPEELIYLEDLEWLSNKSRQHASVDTFARKLHLNSHKSDLLKLKNCLSVFFLLEQLRKPVDPRYDTFFATLLETKHEMPKGLNIISWNYDMQFELAYQAFTDEKDLYTAQDNLGVFLKFKDNWRVTERFGIYKLNGSSVAYTSNNAKLVKVYSKAPIGKISIETLQEIFQSYCFFKNNPKEYDLGLSFAWEDENTNFGRKDIVTVTKEKTIDTQILVVVGYSIPFFNRQIDRGIIKNMTKLEKVYFQSPDADALIERFTSIRNDLDSTVLLPIKNCDQFHLPNEL